MAVRAQTERAEMEVLAAWLDLRGLLWCHVGNEGMHKPQHRAAMARQGVKPGVPDVLIFTPPQHAMLSLLRPRAAGTALELKAGKGRVTPAQSEWLEHLRDVGWECAVKVGADAAIAWLTSLGY